MASKQGVRFVFTDGSRIIFRLSVCTGFCFACSNLKAHILSTLSDVIKLYIHTGNWFSWCYRSNLR